MRRGSIYTEGILGVTQRVATIWSHYISGREKVASSQRMGFKGEDEHRSAWSSLPTVSSVSDYCADVK